MNAFWKQAKELFEPLGSSAEMVLATSVEGRVSARTVSLILREGWFYFRTDKTHRKYAQMLQNPHVALCLGNFQLEGICRELTLSADRELFHQAYKEAFPRPFTTYIKEENERIFSIEPVWVQKWVFENGMPYTVVLDFNKEEVQKIPYFAEP